MWFGDLVTMRWWDDLWLNESFATFVSVLCQARRPGGPRPGPRSRTSRRPGRTGRTSCPPPTRSPPTSPTCRRWRSTSTGSPTPRAPACSSSWSPTWGSSEFLRAMRVYFRRHEYGNTTLADLLARAGRGVRPGPVAVVHAVAGDRRDQHAAADVRAWTSRAGTPRSRSLQGAAEPGGGPLRDHRLAIGLYNADGAKAGRAPSGWRSTSAARAPRCRSWSGEARPDLVLINDDDLTYAKVRLDDRSLATAVARVGRHRRLAAPGAVLGRGLGHDPGRRDAPPGTTWRWPWPASRARPRSAWCSRCRASCAARWTGSPTRAGRPTGGPGWPRSRREATAGGRARLGPPARLDPDLGGGRAHAGARRGAARAARRHRPGARPGRGRRPALDAAAGAGRGRRGRRRGDRRRAGARPDRVRAAPGGDRDGAAADRRGQGGGVAAGHRGRRAAQRDATRRSSPASTTRPSTS